MDIKESKVTSTSYTNKVNRTNFLSLNITPNIPSPGLVFYQFGSFRWARAILKILMNLVHLFINIL